ncbi:MAG: AAA family ATPase, partial [Cyclobacteriaceae bacterium]
MEELIDISAKLIAKVPRGFKRYLHGQISWNNRLIGIKGARGTGKSTMLLQWLYERNLPQKEAAYFSLDELYFTQNSLLDIAQHFYSRGGKVLVLDEIHKYPDWSRTIKNLHDRYEDLQIVFTGSSIIDITRQEADLSRRMLMYELKGLSFREYMLFEHGINLPIITLEQLLSGSDSIRSLFPTDFKPYVY